MNKKKVYLYPFNDISSRLSLNNSFQQKYELIKFIDENKKSDSLIKLNQLNYNDEYIIVTSKQYYKEIYYNLIKKSIPKEKILFYIEELNLLTRNSLFMTFAQKIISFKDKYFAQKNNTKLKSFTNIHNDKRAFIIGNGPSLKVEDLQKLNNDITFGCNKIYLSFEEANWHPTYYFVEDDLVYIQNYDEINNLNLKYKFFPYRANYWGKVMSKAIFFNLIFMNKDDEDFPKFNPNPQEMYWGSTVIYTMIQWAIYMGIKEIYLIGMDFNFQIPNNSCTSQEGRIELINDIEKNHFHKDYRKQDEKWNLPNLDIQLNAFSKAREYGDKNDIKIYNASRETKLDIFEKVNLDTLF